MDEVPWPGAPLVVWTTLAVALAPHHLAIDVADEIRASLGHFLVEGSRTPFELNNVVCSPPHPERLRCWRASPFRWRCRLVVSC